MLFSIVWATGQGALSISRSLGNSSSDFHLQFTSNLLYAPFRCPMGTSKPQGSSR